MFVAHFKTTYSCSAEIRAFSSNPNPNPSNKVASIAFIFSAQEAIVDSLFQIGIPCLSLGGLLNYICYSVDKTWVDYAVFYCAYCAEGSVKGRKDETIYKTEERRQYHKKTKDRHKTDNVMGDIDKHKFATESNLFLDGAEYNPMKSEIYVILKKNQRFISRKDINVGSIIGHGASGRVYEGLYGTICVAIKICHIPFGMDKESTDATLKEALLLLSCQNHPNVIRLYGVGFFSQVCLCHLYLSCFCLD